MLKREADMDGVVVVSMAEIGRNLGITQTTIFKHINELIRRGELVKDEDATFNHQLKQYTIVNF
jgi:biotin operon repressor